jgi:stearoyl-CoA desaturase (delta-9 desaturase)
MMRILNSIALWFDSEATHSQDDETDRIDWLRIIPFIFLHVMVLGVFWVGFSWVALGVCVVFYVVRMFAITAFYHRYFSHRTFETSRVAQFLFALLGCMAVQRGPIWWASQHRHHHRFSDQESDGHSPGLKGFMWSHVLWFLSDRHFKTKHEYVKDWGRFPELRLLDRFDLVVPVATAFLMYGLGALIQFILPTAGTSGPQMMIWGFFISTVCLFHATFSINSLAHMYGRRRFETTDDSRNNLFLALLTLGEGWHNNHHHYPISARQGFYWWEIDVSWYVLLIMKRLGLIWNMRTVPEHVREEGAA